MTEREDARGRVQRRRQLAGSLAVALLLTLGTALAVGAVLDPTRADAVTDEGRGRGGDDDRGGEGRRGSNQGRG
jgi:hypothetical protein